MGRTCTKCNIEKELESFSKDKYTGKPYSICKECRRIQDNLYRKNPERKEKQSAYNKERYNKDKGKKRKILTKVYSQTLNGKLCRYKTDAKRRGLSFDLTKDEFSSFWQVPCTYCGSEVATIGIDRIDSSIGYSIDNCVSCCTMCNYMKLDYSMDEWLDKMKQILKHLEIHHG
jgi:hypothetical protein